MAAHLETLYDLCMQLPASCEPRGAYRACGKLILLGEHFVVHGAPALALPLLSLATEVEVLEEPGDGAPRLEAELPEADVAHSRRLLVAALAGLGLAEQRGWCVRVRSSIPIGHGLGSSAAYAVALVGALARAGGRALSPEELHAQAHALEQLSHGWPSGIDDTVITLARPLWFRRGEPPRPLPPRPELGLLLASSGRPGSTREAVASVAELREAKPARFAALLAEAEVVAGEGREAFLDGDDRHLGVCLDRNHALLVELGVSTPELDRLANAAREAGALGAKLTGSGRGGFLVALAATGDLETLASTLADAGAAAVLAMGEVP